MSYLSLSSDVADAALKAMGITDLLIDDGCRLDLGGWLGRPLVRGDRSLADHVVTERGLDGLDVAHGASSGIKMSP